MTSCIRISSIIALIICMALPARGEQYLLYTPQPATSGQKPSSQEGILVQIIEIQKGDTLYDLSKKFSGRGMYYPQILLFNSIKNPDLIYQGQSLKIPLTQKGTPDSDQGGLKSTDASLKQKASGDSKSAVKAEAAAQAPVLNSNAKPQVRDLKKAGREKRRPGRQTRKPVVSAKKKSSQESPGPSASSLLAHKNKDAAGQKLFEEAVKAYRLDDCSTAIELLDRYLADNSASPLAADANLYKAECYLKLSAQ